MKERAILLRDSSRDSELAEQILKDLNINYTGIFSRENNGLPCLISPVSAYAYEGLHGVRLFVRTVKNAEQAR